MTESDLVETTAAPIAVRVRRAIAAGEGGGAGVSGGEHGDASGGVRLDEEQQALLQDVSDWLDPVLAGASASEPAPPVGWFVHGAAGRGKTWLLGQVFAAAPVPQEAKRRVHFHQFFLALQKRLGPRASARNAIDATVEDLLAGTRLFFFDELHVQDPGAAALLNRLLAEIAERRVPTLITSNYAPEGLLPHRVYHHVVQPGIDTLRREFTVRELAGTTDYRRRGGGAGTRFASGSWVLGPGPMPDVAPVTSAAATTVLRDHHAVDALAVRGTQVILDARTFLESPVTSKDVIDLATQFDDWVLMDLPSLSGLTRWARQRLVTVVDVLVDADVRLTVSSEVSRSAMSDVADPPADWFRAASRLDMLGS